MAITIVPKGRRPRDVGASTTIIASQAGDIAHIDLSGYIKQGEYNFGIHIQPKGTAVTPAMTIHDKAIAMDPSNAAAYAAIPWKSFTAVADQDLVVLSGFFGTVLRITFTAAGVAVVAFA